jgi:hypothetical protein
VLEGRGISFFRTEREVVVGDGDGNGDGDSDSNELLERMKQNLNNDVHKDCAIYKVFKHSIYSSHHG